MDAKTEHALKITRGSFKLFARNGRWGTCVHCPRDNEWNFYPEFCEHTERYDHNLTLNELVESWNMNFK